MQCRFTAWMSGTVKRKRIEVTIIVTSKISTAKLSRPNMNLSTSGPRVWARKEDSKSPPEVVAKNNTTERPIKNTAPAPYRAIRDRRGVQNSCLTSQFLNLWAGWGRSDSPSNGIGVFSSRERTLLSSSILQTFSMMHAFATSWLLFYCTLSSGERSI